jgi:hypothetical protein
MMLKVFGVMIIFFVSLLLLSTYTVSDSVVVQLLFVLVT